MIGPVMRFMNYCLVRLSGMKTGCIVDNPGTAFAAVEDERLGLPPERRPEMHNLVSALVLAVCISVPQLVFAAEAAPVQSPTGATGSSLKNQLPELLEKLGINIISKARAAESIEEGETSTSNEQCWSGLGCVGVPPASCSP